MYSTKLLFLRDLVKPEAFHLRCAPLCCVQVWSFALLKNETCLVTGSSDLELRVYSLSTEAAGSSSDDGEGAVRLGAKRRAEDSGSRVSLHMKCWSLQCSL